MISDLKFHLFLTEMKRSHSFSNIESTNYSSSPPIQLDKICIPDFLRTIELNLGEPLAERESLAQSALEVNEWILGYLMDQKSMTRPDTSELLSLWLTSFELLALWLAAVLALKVEDLEMAVSETSVSVLLVAESQARNVPHDLPHCCSLSLLLVNLMLSQKESNELDSLIETVRSFQLICSPVNLLITFMLEQTVYTAAQYFHLLYDLPCLYWELSYIRILSGSANARAAILSVISRLVSRHSFSLNVINPDGSYPLHQAMSACLTGYTPPSFVMSLLELGAYPYSYSQSQLCTAFEWTADTMHLHGSYHQLQYIKTECERLGIIARVPPLRTLSARCLSKYQINTDSWPIPASVREFIKWHQYDPLKIPCLPNEDTSFEILEGIMEREKRTFSHDAMAHLLYDPATPHDEYPFFAIAHRTPGSVLEVMLQQPWIHSSV